MSKEEKKVNRRDFLFTASYTVGAVGVGAVIWPMIDQMNPDKASLQGGVLQKWLQGSSVTYATEP